MYVHYFITIKLRATSYLLLFIKNYESYGEKNFLGKTQHRLKSDTQIHSPKTPIFLFHTICLRNNYPFK